MLMQFAAPARATVMGQTARGLPLFEFKPAAAPGFAPDTPLEALGGCSPQAST